MLTTPTDDVARHAALVKLARVLEVDESELDFLEPLDVATLHELREQCAARLHEEDAERLGAVAAAGRLLPAGVSAAIAQRFFGPSLVARLVGLLEPERAAQQARHIDTKFMADVAARADAHVISALSAHLSLTMLQDITKVLVERDDVVTLSLFVGPLPAETIAAILEAVDDHAAVVRIAQYVEQSEALDPIVSLLPDHRVKQLLGAVRDQALSDEAVHLFAQLGDTQTSRLRRLATDVEGLSPLVRSALGVAD